MPADKIEEQLASLLRAVRGDIDNGVPGLVQRVTDLQRDVRSMVDEQREWREDVDKRLRTLESAKPVTVSERAVWASGALVIATLALLLLLLFAVNWRQM
jgi:hypothetical protein